MSGKTIVEIYEDARQDCKTRAQFYMAASVKRFEEGNYHLSALNIIRARRWEHAELEYRRVLMALRGYDPVW